MCVFQNSVFGTRITQFCHDTEISWCIFPFLSFICFRSFYFQCPANMCKLILLFRSFFFVCFAWLGLCILHMVGWVSILIIHTLHMQYKYIYDYMYVFKFMRWPINMNAANPHRCKFHRNWISKMFYRNILKIILYIFIHFYLQFRWLVKYRQGKAKHKNWFEWDAAEGNLYSHFSYVCGDRIRTNLYEKFFSFEWKKKQQHISHCLQCTIARIDTQNHSV